MKHASDTNRKDRAQREARRETFKGNHSDKSRLKNDAGGKVDFSHLSEEDITAERKRIADKYRARKKNVWTFVIMLLVVKIMITCILLYLLL